MVASVIDIVAHAAVAVWHGGPAPTVTLQIDYLAPAIGPELHARGILRRMGRTVSRADAEISAGGKLVSIGRGTFSTKEA
jgi:acyl-coenzyme A thioesterase PaaI-like protein